MGQRECSNSLAAEPWAGWVSGIEWDRGNTVTHELQSHGWAGSAGLNGREEMQQLTCCRAVGGLGQRD